MDGMATILNGAQERRRIRAGNFTGPTSGLAPGNVQANLVILPRDLAHDFLRFAMANPKPCPILAVSEAGSPHFPTLGADLDIREGDAVDAPSDPRRISPPAIVDRRGRRAGDHAA